VLSIKPMWGNHARWRYFIVSMFCVPGYGKPLGWFVLRLRNWAVGMFSGEGSLPRAEGSSRFGRLWQVPTTNLGLAVAELMLLWHLFRFLIVQVIVRFA